MKQFFLVIILSSPPKTGQDMKVFQNGRKCQISEMIRKKFFLEKKSHKKVTIQKKQRKKTQNSGRKNLHTNKKKQLKQTKN